MALTNTQNNAIAQENALLTENISKLQESLDEANAKLVQIKNLMDIKEAAFKKGIINIDILTDVRISYYNLLQEIRSHEAALIQTKASINDLIDKWQERQRDMNEKINATETKLKLLKVRWKNANHIYSTVSGIVTEVQVQANDFVEKGQNLLSIIPSNQNLYALAFISAKEGKNVKPDMSAQVKPSGFNKLEFGAIKGTVLYVSPFSVTYNHIFAELKNPKLVDEFLKVGPVFSVAIRLQKDLNTKSGFAWTSSKGPDSTLSQGTLVNVLIQTREIRPIMLVIPAIEYVFRS